jgi:hypothetical protein
VAKGDNPDAYKLNNTQQGEPHSNNDFTAESSGAAQTGEPTAADAKDKVQDRGIVTVVPAAGLLFLIRSVLAQLLSAFKTDPQALLEQPVSSVGRFIRNLLLMPSLIGKTNVRLEFAKNLGEVVEALKPQRLVIFLDDLDRCIPQQVVQILGAINFLSSAAACFIIIGADYEKVETLVAMQFETVAQQEAENDRPSVELTRQTRVEERMRYARNYMRKIVNLRLDLPEPTVQEFQMMLTVKRLQRRPGKSLPQTALVVAALLVSVAASINLWFSWYAPFRSSPTQSQQNTPAQIRNAPPQTTGSAQAEGTVRPEVSTQQHGPLDSQFSSGGSLKAPSWLLWCALGGVATVSFGFLVIVWRRPKDDERAKDSQQFTEALGEVAGAIVTKCQTPREVRRFLNYLRIIAANDEPLVEETPPQSERTERPTRETAITKSMRFSLKSLLNWRNALDQRSKPVQRDSRYDSAYVKLAAYGLNSQEVQGIATDAVDSFKRQCARSGVPISYFSVVAESLVEPK